MKFHPTNSISSYLAIPQVQPISNSGLPLKVPAAAIKAFWEGKGGQTCPVPDQQAIEFYCLNHLSAIVRAKFNPMVTLPKWAQSVMSYYQTSLVNQSHRMFSYMLQIITREARHLHSQDENWYAALTALSCKNVSDFVSQLSGKNEDQAVHAMCDTPPDCTLGQFVRGIVYVFNKGHWSGGYGGKPWGNIAQCLLDCVDGKTSLEVMLDSSFSLAHNNGPMFNKGMLYKGHTQRFIRILDVQRSGQIPEGVLNNEFTQNTYGGGHNGHVESSLIDLVKSVKSECPEAFGLYVDWYKVEALGAVQQYPSEKQAQDKKYGKSKATLEAEAVAAEKAVKAAAEAAAAAAKAEAEHIEAMAKIKAAKAAAKAAKASGGQFFITASLSVPQSQRPTKKAA
jgi:hypothetical protein